MKNTIFGQIASYRDPQLMPTLESMISNSEHPENLHIMVNWQHGDEQTMDDFLDAGYDISGYRTYKFTDIDEKEKEFNIIELKRNGAFVDLIDLDYTETKGTCWARNLIQQLYDGEKYTIQLDSHHRFVENWDTTVIDMLESVRTEDVPKPVLTGYIPSYDPENDPEGRVMTPWQTNFDRFIPEGAVFFIPSEMKDWRNRTKPQKARFYSGHFAFADGSFAEDVQHHPSYFFHGEEISIAARAYTHGYDLFTPHRIIAWHEYTRKNRVKVWDPNNHSPEDAKKGKVEKDWVQRNNECHKLNRILFGMDGEDPNQVDFGKYGFGTKRSLRDYEEYAGINFKLRGAQKDTLDQKDPPNDNSMYNTREEWLNSFHTSVDVRICVHKNDLGEIPDDLEYCFVGVHDENENELHRKDLNREEFLKYYNNGDWIDYRYICVTNKIPTYYILWPYSKSKGWMTRIVREVTDYNN